MNRVTAQVDKPLAGANLQAHLEGLRTDMRKAAENLEFEEAARLRDEVKRLEAVDLAVSDDPLARQQAVEKASAEAAVGSRGRSTAGEPGQRGGTLSGGKRASPSGPKGPVIVRLYRAISHGDAPVKTELTRVKWKGSRHPLASPCPAFAIF